MTNAEILARFPGPLRLNQPRWKYLLIFVFSGLLAGSGLGNPVKFKMWLPLLCFGPVALFNLLALLPSANALTLRGDRLQWSYGFRRWTVPWSHVHDFVVSGSDRYARVAFKEHGKSGGSISSPGGRNFTMSHTFGRSAEELAALLTQWRERALAAQTDAAPKTTAAIEQAKHA